MPGPKKCPHCDRNGLDPKQAGQRHRCRLCHKEAPGKHDRVLYLVYYASCDGGHLGRGSVSYATFSRPDARRYAELQRENTRSRNFRADEVEGWVPYTCDGRVGMAFWQTGTFQYLDEILVDASKLETEGDAG